MDHVQETIKRPEAPAPRKRLPLYAFFTGSAISYIGDMLTFLAIPWFVLQSTGSVTQTGITAFFSTLPTVFSAFFGSTLVDRLGYKRTSVIGDIASGLTVALIPLLYNTIGLAFWQLLALVFLGGLLKSPGVTARSSLVPDLAARATMRLERANALTDGVNRVARFIGAPLAGILIVVIGTSNLLWLDAASFAFSAILIGLAVPATTPLLNATDGPRRYLATVWEGVRFLQQDALIGAIVVIIMITNLLDAAWSSVVGPAYIKSVFHSVLPFGLMVAALGGAAFVGTLIYGAIGHRLPRRLTYGIGYTVGGALPLLDILAALLTLAHRLAGRCWTRHSPHQSAYRYHHTGAYSSCDACARLWHNQRWSTGRYSAWYACQRLPGRVARVAPDAAAHWRGLSCGDAVSIDQSHHEEDGKTSLH